MRAEGVKSRINGIIRYLVEAGLASDQQFAFRRTLRDGIEEVTFAGGENVGWALKNANYEDAYVRFRRSRAYNVRMPDGALIQVMYRFTANDLLSHRLAFLPATRLERFQGDPELYLDDDEFGHEVGRVVVAFPIRFDYHSADQRHQPVLHPKSHLTLGEFPECRIPVSAPVGPMRFVDFILRNFYDTPERTYAAGLPVDRISFDCSIDPLEREVMHIVVPESSPARPHTGSP